MSNALVLDSQALCSVLSWLIQVTVSPVLMVKLAGVKAKSLIQILWFVACPSAFAKVAARGTVAVVAARRITLRRVNSIIGLTFVEVIRAATDGLSERFQKMDENFCRAKNAVKSACFTHSDYLCCFRKGPLGCADNEGDD